MQQSGHILDGNGVGTGVFNSLTHIHPGLDIVHRADGIGNRALGMPAHLLDGLECDVQVAHIVHRVKHPEHINPVVCGALDKLLHYIICIVAIAQDILPPEQHLLRRVGHGFF